MTRPPRNAPLRACIEPLEPRIAPAVLLNARTLAFTDIDGDYVTVKFSKDVFTGDFATQLAKANEVFKFDTSNVAPGDTTPQQLQLIDFTKFPSSPLAGSIVNGVGITITAEARGGNGLADVGAIKAGGVTLGVVKIDGDLGQIDAGRTNARVGLAGLFVHSLGGRGTATQIPVPAPTAENPAPDLVSTITGELTTLKVIADVTEARLSVLHGRDSQGNLTTLGNLGSISIGGSLIGREALAVASESTGFIEADGNIGAVKIGTTVADGIHGGGGKTSGRILAGGSIASVTISGGIDGGAGVESGTISASGIGRVSIGGSIIGGSGEGSGGVRSLGNLGAVKIAGDLVAGVGAGSGVIFSRGAMGAVFAGGSIDGSLVGAGAGSAGFYGQAGIASVQVDGHVLGGAQAQTGFIESGRNLGPVKILGNLVGGAGDGSGAVIAHGKLAAISIGGVLLGGAGRQSGFIRSGFDPLQSGDLGTVSIAGTMHGGGGDDSGAIVSGGAIGSVRLGSIFTTHLEVLRGGAGAFSGAISSVGKIGSAKIMGGVRGGGGDFSGSLIAFERAGAAEEITGDIGNITIASALTGGSGARSGAILADGKLGALTVGAIEGGPGAASASVQTGRGLLGAGHAGAIKIAGTLSQVATGIPGAGSATIDIGGNLAALSTGGSAIGATIHAGDAIGALKFGGDVTNVTVTARGQVVQGAKSDVAIASIVVRGGVTGSTFLAGYDAAGGAVNPDAQIGSVTVRGGWIASNLVAGIAEGPDAGFGNAQDIVASGFDNTAITSRIASVIIGGAATGSAAPDDHFGFVAQVIAKFKANGIVAPLKDSIVGQIVEFDTVNNDVTLREVIA